MPEGPEVDTDGLREKIAERPTEPLLRNIALTTALLAALGAVAALRAGDTVNEALVLKTEAARLQAEASDQWAYYQAKGIKGAVQETARTVWIASGKTPPASLDQSIHGYSEDQRTIEKAARDKEHARDESSAAADRLLERHHRFANSVAFVQVAIALGAVAALARNRMVWLLSLALGAVGVSLFFMTVLG